MSTDKTDPSKKDATISSADDLVKSSDVELREEELNRVTGGSITKPIDKTSSTFYQNAVSGTTYSSGGGGS